MIMGVGMVLIYQPHAHIQVVRNLNSGFIY